MREITTTKQFRKDLKREKKGQHRTTVEADLQELVDLLVEDADLPEAFCDHPMVGNWKGFRDAHVKPDLILIYEKVGDDELQLVRIGSHSELGI